MGPHGAGPVAAEGGVEDEVVVGEVAVDGAGGAVIPLVVPFVGGAVSAGDGGRG